MQVMSSSSPPSSPPHLHPHDSSGDAGQDWATGPSFDPFTALGLHPDDNTIAMDEARLREQYIEASYKRLLLTHLPFPSTDQIHLAFQYFLHGQAERLHLEWVDRHVPAWDPWATTGSTVVPEQPSSSSSPLQQWSDGDDGGDAEGQSVTVEEDRGVEATGREPIRPDGDEDKDEVLEAMEGVLLRSGREEDRELVEVSRREWARVVVCSAPRWVARPVTGRVHKVNWCPVAIVSRMTLYRTTMEEEEEIEGRVWRGVNG